MGSIESTVMALELELLEPAVRSDYQRLDALLADDFHEVGASGRSFGKADILLRLPGERGVAFATTDMQAYPLSSTVVLVTYQAIRSHAGETAHSKRSSVWVHRSHGWQMRYHQGTSGA